MKVTVKESVRVFILALDKESRGSVHLYTALLEEHGHLLRMPFSRCILRGIFELRVGGVHNIRLIYSYKDGGATIFHAFMKKTEQIETSELRIIRMKHANL